MNFFQRNKPTVDLIAREPISFKDSAPTDGGVNELLWLQSDTLLKGQVKVLARVGNDPISLTLLIVGEGTSYDTLDLLIERLGYTRRPFLLLAHLQQPLTLWPHLQVLLEPKPEPAGNKRAHDRHEFRLRIMSPDLPGYQGVATNLSEQGTEVECSGPLDIGRRVELKLEPDRGAVRSLEVAGIVRRCQGSARRYRVGVQFAELSAVTLAKLQEIVKTLEEREPGVIKNERHLN